MGITPARAGNRVAEAFIPNPLKDHPRACGEQCMPCSPRGMIKGSPPRVRGTDRRPRSFHHRTRITPARAGNRVLPPLCPPQMEDHPRACGEQHFTAMVEAIARITPACAGNRSCRSRPGVRRDHPRACGEQLTPTIVTIAVGSPPRVRGTVTCVYGRQSDRITPACAGNSDYCPQVNGFGDHPRVCGEQAFPSQKSIRNRITPACAGNRWRNFRDPCHEGITPACAGNRSKVWN